MGDTIYSTIACTVSIEHPCWGRGAFIRVTRGAIASHISTCCNIGFESQFPARSTRVQLHQSLPSFFTKHNVKTRRCCHCRSWLAWFPAKSRPRYGLQPSFQVSTILVQAFRDMTITINMTRPLVLMDLSLRSRTTSNRNRSSHRQLHTVFIMSVMSVAGKVSIHQIPDGLVRCLAINMARPLVLMDLALRSRSTSTEIILT